MRGRHSNAIVPLPNFFLIIKIELRLTVITFYGNSALVISRPSDPMILLLHRLPRVHRGLASPPKPGQCNECPECGLLSQKLGYRMNGGLGPLLPLFTQYISPFQRSSQRMVRNPHIDLGGPEAGMPKQCLDHPDVDSLLDQQRRGGVPEPVRGSGVVRSRGA